MNHIQYELARIRRAELVRQGGEQRLAARATTTVTRTLKAPRRRPRTHRRLRATHPRG